MPAVYVHVGSESISASGDPWLNILMRGKGRVNSFMGKYTSGCCWLQPHLMQRQVSQDTFLAEC